LKANTDPSSSNNEKLCIDCARSIPLAAKRCTHDNCGVYQDWRRFLGTQPNLVSVSTLAGVIVAILFNLYQIRELAQKASTEDIARVQESIEQKIPRLVNEITALETDLLSVPDEFVNRYKQFLASPNTGIIKIMPGGKYEQVMLMRGGGAYYSFSRKTHEYGYGSDLLLNEDRFSVGFAGADYGFFLKLGDIPIQDISSDPNPPPSLDPRLKEAWSHMWAYTPPPELANLRLEARAYGWEGVRVGEANLTEAVPAEEQNTYLLRSLNIDNSDVLVAFRTESKLEDSSYIIVWKILENFDVPVATGPDLQE
jgi:hypothetical protein